MKTNNNRPINVAVDMGNYNFKLHTGDVFANQICKKTIDSFGAEESITFEGVTYLLGQGTRELKGDKTKKTYIPQLLYSIHQCLRKEDLLQKNNEVNLAIGSPIIHAMNSRDKFKEELLDRCFIYNIGESDERTITIKNLMVNAECISAFYSLNKADRQGSVLLIDIGGLTVNVTHFEDGKMVNKKTINEGMIDLVNKIRDFKNSTGNVYSFEQVEKMIYKGNIENQEMFYLEFIKLIIDELEGEKIFLTDEKVKILYDNILLTGGGAILLEDTFKTKVPSIRSIEDPLFANVKGNKKLMDVKWSEI